MSAQPVHEEPDPRDPQVIHDQLPARERTAFLAEYRAALHAAGDDPAKYQDLQKLLTRWRMVADAANDPGYYDALNEARTATRPGLSPDEVAEMRRAG